jgi:SecD/SecF fusion protein
MPENYSGRIALIVAVLLISLVGIFSPVLVKLRHPHEPIASYIALKPGIDMVGGTSLVYQIKTAPGQGYDPELASKVATSLKKRVDPDGVMNLVWRPEGADRLEIQMPSSGVDSTQATAAGQALISAEKALENTNLSITEAVDAIEQKNGHTRAEFERLSQGSKIRLDQLNNAAAAFDALAALRAKPLNERNPLEEAKLEQAYEQKKAALNFSNFDVTRFREDLADKTTHDSSLSAALKQQADFPARLKAINDYATALSDYEKLKRVSDDTTDLKRKLQGSGVLEFHILVSPSEDPTEASRMLQRLKPDGPGPAVQGGDRMRWFAIDSGAENSEKFAGDIVTTYHNKNYVLTWITAEKSLDHREGQKQWALADARRVQANDGAGSVVGFTFDPQGASYFDELTGSNINRPLGIVLDGKIISAPSIHARISASGTIDGGSNGFTNKELDYLVSTLSAGSLPAQLEDEPISERHVEPELGHANLMHGLVACIVGVAVVGVFLISYYYVAGVVAFFAVLMNLLIVLFVMSFLGATFTLPSIAGIVLSVGTAVDANVLIFERLREEQHRGLSIRMALRNAYDKAFSAIIDSNATTFITSVFLIWKGTEEVKGFGITLVIGIVASLFTALFVTRTIFGVLIDKGIVHDLRSLPITFPKWDKLLRPSIDWMSYAWAFYGFSAIAISIGLVLFGIKVHQHEMFDIEFAGGTSVQFDLTHPMSKAELINQLAGSDKEVIKTANPVPLGSASEGNKYSSFNLLARSTDAVAVRDAVIATLRNELKLELPSGFDGAGPGGTAAPLDAVLGKQVLAVADDTKWPTSDGKPFRPDSWGDYTGGVAIVLTHLDPPLTPAQITERINRELLQSNAARRPFTVESPSGPGRSTDLAIVLSKDPTITADKDVKQFDDLVAGPFWRNVVEGVDRPAQLKEVRNFDAQVAGDAQTNAIVALVLSIAVIMVYIWVRFGNLKYGTATMVALLHDTIFTIAALGFAHYLADVPLLKQIFQLEPFRINLTVVAGILTIMGYSMIDTIVVFDRIRENRGKYGLVSRKTINDAVNQTLSRTLLTAGTTTVTVGIMYFLGGEGIHGFTFVLLIGILVGTYSSVAIAAPILLIGKHAAAESNPGTMRSGSVSASRV